MKDFYKKLGFTASTAEQQLRTTRYGITKKKKKNKKKKTTWI